MWKTPPWEMQRPLERVANGTDGTGGNARYIQSRGAHPCRHPRRSCHPRWRAGSCSRGEECSGCRRTPGRSCQNTARGSRGVQGLGHLHESLVGHDGGDLRRRRSCGVRTGYETRTANFYPGSRARVMGERVTVGRENTNGKSELLLLLLRELNLRHEQEP
nr:hypothetical protein CFP56_10455 [Quercus suber]